MFFVINKDKIISYLVAISTVVMLFIMATTFSSDNVQTIQTAAGTNKELPIYSVGIQDEKIALTINCAWNADDIDSILETLNKTNCKVTFFMVGDWVDKYPDAVKKIYDQGHEIGNHSNSHPHVNNLNYENNKEEIKLCSDKIEKITGKPTTLYRGPYGEYNNTVIKAARDSNHITIQWSLDTLDYNELTGEEMWNRIKDKLQNGSIILMHNGTKNTANSLEMLINNIKNKGYDITKVSDIIYTENYTIDNNGIQHKNK